MSNLLKNKLLLEQALEASKNSYILFYDLSNLEVSRQEELKKKILFIPLKRSGIDLLLKRLEITPLRNRDPSLRVGFLRNSNLENIEVLMNIPYASGKKVLREVEIPKGDSGFGRGLITKEIANLKGESKIISGKVNITKRFVVAKAGEKLGPKEYAFLCKYFTEEELNQKFILMPNTIVLGNKELSYQDYSTDVLTKSIEKYIENRDLLEANSFFFEKGRNNLIFSHAMKVLYILKN